MPHFDYGPNLLEHLLLEAEFTQNTKVKDFQMENIPRLSDALNLSAKQTLVSISIVLLLYCPLLVTKVCRPVQKAT